MPARSKAQQRLFGLAYAVKKGDLPRSAVSDDVLGIVDSLSKAKIRDFAATKHDGLPDMVELVSMIRRKNPIHEDETGYTFELTEDEYQGRDVELEKPFRLGDDEDKKFAVYVKNDKGNVVRVEFGDPNMEIKRDDDARRKSFRARHKCDTDPGPKYKAKYWSCKFWEKGKTVTDLLNEKPTLREWLNNKKNT